MQKATRALLAGFLMLAGCSEPEAPQASIRAVPVTLRSVSYSGSYSLERSYLGTVEARRHSELGFELAGEVREILFDEGEAIEAGAVLARLDSDRLEARRDEAAAALAEARANLRLAEASLKRANAAAVGDSISEQQRDEAERQKELSEASVQRAKAALAAVERDLEETVLTAPFAGEISARFIDPGTIVSAGQTVVTLLETAAWELRVGLPAIEAAKLEPGASATINHRGKDWPATLLRRSSNRSAQTRTVDAIFQLPAEVPALEGDTAYLVRERTVKERGFWLPMSALTEGERGLWAVYRAEPAENRAEATHRLQRVDVELIYQSGDRVYARGPLQEGDSIVQEGLHRLVNQQRVKVAK